MQSSKDTIHGFAHAQICENGSIEALQDRIELQQVGIIEVIKQDGSSYVTEEQSMHAPVSIIIFLPVDFWHFRFSVEQFHQPPTPLIGVNHQLCDAVLSL